jgi:hypothetical protein
MSKPVDLFVKVRKLGVTFRQETVNKVSCPFLLLISEFIAKVYNVVHPIRIFRGIFKLHFDLP